MSLPGATLLEDMLAIVEQTTDDAVHQTEPAVVERGVVHGHGARGTDGPAEVDHLGRFAPRGIHGEQEHVDRRTGRGEGVAGVVDPGPADVDQEPGVGDARQVLVDDRMQLADRPDRQADVERLAG